MSWRSPLMKQVESAEVIANAENVPIIPHEAG